MGRIMRKIIKVYSISHDLLPVTCFFHGRCI